MKKQRNYILDIYRIGAVLLVLMVHCRGYISEKPYIVNFIMGLGSYGVALYFVISGFFSEESCLKYSSKVAYYKNRCVRILQMY